MYTNNDTPTGNWQACVMKGYDSASALYTVLVTETGETRQVPRIHLLFDTEDPFAFTARVVAAFEAKQQSEAFMVCKR